MSMTLMIAAAAGLAFVFCLAVYFSIFLLNEMAAGASEFSEAASAFYKAADTLASDAETPREILGMIAGLNESIDNKKCARRILRYMSQANWWKDKAGSGERHKVVAEFLHRRPELEEPFKALLVNWFLAVTAISPIAGHFARIAFTDNGVEHVAAKVGRTAKMNDDLDTPTGGRRLKVA